MTNPLHSREAVIEAIESFMLSTLESIGNGEIPTLANERVGIMFIPRQARTFASIVLVFTHAHMLLPSNTTATTRQIFYFHREYFSNQRECHNAILNAASLLGVPHVCLEIYEE